MLGVFPLHHIADAGVSERMTFSYSAVKLFRRIPTYLNTVPDRYGQTDGQTDGRLTVA